MKYKYFLSIFFVLTVVLIIQSVFIYRLINKESDKESIIGSYEKYNNIIEEHAPLDGIIVRNGFIPDYKTAIKMAELIWKPIYGDAIYNEKPFNAVLKNDSIWIIYGTLPNNTVGGTFTIEFRKSDAKILRVFHAK